MHVVLFELQAQNRKKNIINDKMIEERCMMYCQTIHDRLEAMEKGLRDKFDEGKAKELIREEIAVAQLLPKQLGLPEPQAPAAGVGLKETVKEIQDKKATEANSLIFRAPEPQTILKEIREKEDMEMVDQLCNNICQAAIDPKTEIAKTVRLG